jgi:hypothetical protein
MSPTSERRLPRPSVEARVQLDRVELLCVPGEPIPRCQRGLVQDGVPVVVAPSRRPDPDVTHSPPSPPSTHRVMLEAAYSHPPRLLSQSIALRSRQPASRQQGSHRQSTRSRCGGSGWRSSPGVTAQRTPPESRWRRCGRGSSMSDAWAINGPLRTANAGPPASAISAPGCLNARLQAQRPRASKLVMSPLMTLHPRNCREMHSLFASSKVVDHLTPQSVVDVGVRHGIRNEPPHIEH